MLGFSWTKGFYKTCWAFDRRFAASDLEWITPFQEASEHGHLWKGVLLGGPTTGRKKSIHPFVWYLLEPGICWLISFISCFGFCLVTVTVAGRVHWDVLSGWKREAMSPLGTVPCFLSSCFRGWGKSPANQPGAATHLPDTMLTAIPHFPRGILLWSQMPAHQQARKEGFVWNRTSNEGSETLQCNAPN